MQTPARPAHALLLPLLLLALAPAALAAPKKLPPSMPLCKKSDPELNECVKRNVQASIPDLVKGLKDASVPSIDPIYIQKLHIDNGQGSVNIKLTLTNTSITGIRDVEIRNVEMDVNKPHFRAEVVDPALQLIGPYRVDGKVLLLPLTGEGNSNFTLENTRYVVEVDGEFVEKGDRRYWDVKNLAIKVDLGRLHIDLENLFNGDKTLGKQMNQFLNENSADIFAELQEPLEQTFAQALQHIAHRLFIRVPFDDIFLD